MVYRDPTLLDLAFYALVAGVILVSVLNDRLSREPTPEESAREAYARGEIDASEFERQLEFHMDDRNEQIREFAEDINDVGPATSRAIAEQFDSLEALRTADRDELEAVHGVGESTADAILERLD